jgi:hypothetical protein
MVPSWTFVSFVVYEFKMTVIRFVAGVARPGDPAPAVRQPLLDGSKARLALLSQISSKSPSGSSFMAKLEDPVEVHGKCLLPKGTLVEGHLETVPARRPMRRGALRMDSIA